MKQSKPSLTLQGDIHQIRTGHVRWGQDTPCWVMLLWEIYLVIFPFFLFFFFVYYVVHLRCQECSKWDSQAARVTVHHHHYHHHHYHHHYYHSPNGIIIIISSSSSLLNFFLKLENNLHHIVFTDFWDHKHSSNTL